MTCPDTGTLRASIDGEAPDAVAHIAACAGCTQAVADLRDQAQYAAAAIALLDEPAVMHPEAVREDALPADVVALPQPRRRSFAAAAAVVVLAVGLVATPAGRTAAADFLAAFRSEQLAVVGVGGSDLDSVADSLAQLGTVDVSAVNTEPVQVADVAAAQARLGRPLVVPDVVSLPAGVDPSPEVAVTDPSVGRFTFDAQRTRAFLESNGNRDVAIPQGYDGAELVVTFPGAVLQSYSGGDALDGLLVGQAGAVTADVNGDISLDTLRDFLLELPALPPEVLRQLEDIDDWRTTLPIPIPLDQIDARDTTVNGADGILVEEPGIGTGLMWQEGGTIIGVAGSLDEDALRRVAAGLHANP